VCGKQCVSGSWWRVAADGCGAQRSPVPRNNSERRHVYSRCATRRREGRAGEDAQRQEGPLVHWLEAALHAQSALYGVSANAPALQSTRYALPRRVRVCALPVNGTRFI